MVCSSAKLGNFSSRSRVAQAMSSWSNSAKTWKSPSKGAFLEDQVLIPLHLVVSCWLFLGMIRDSKTVCLYLLVKSSVTSRQAAGFSQRSLPGLESDTRFTILKQFASANHH